MACPPVGPVLSSHPVATTLPMPISDDNPSEGRLPQLPDLPGLAGLDAPRPPTPRQDLSVEPQEALIGEESEADPHVGIVQPDTEQYLGKSFGGYRLEAKIGQGGMGTVYKGRQVSLDRVVAVKILNKALYENREFIKRFEREAKSIAKINHPNIVAVYDFGVHDGLWFMVNEFIEGQSLSKLITDRLVVGVNEAVTWMVHCLSGLAHVGQGNIVHRDIKPDNILVTKDGIAKIADFGLAKDVSERNDATDLTAVGLAMGTPAYMSPEQCMGRKLDGRSDQYSLGVTAYFALTGQKPFTGQSSFEIMTRQREHVPPDPSKLNPSVPADVSALVMRMLSKDPSDRFLDANACRDAWVEVGTALGCFGATRRSGEFEVPAGLLSSTSSPPPPPGEQRKSARLRSDPAIPAPPPLSLVEPPTLPPPRSLAPSTDPIAVPATRRPATDAPGSPRTSGEWQAGDKPPQSERHRQGAAPAGSGGAAACGKCGNLNRLDAMSCARCGASLREGTPAAAKDQELEAQRLLEAGRHREAAAIYARLADKETDKRARSILRAKEREARKVENERQLADHLVRARAMRERGNLHGAIALLEQGQKLVGDSPAAGTAGTGADGGIAQEIADLRSQVSASRRWRALGVIVVLAVVLAAGLGFAVWKMRQAPIAPPEPAATVIP